MTALAAEPRGTRTAALVRTRGVHNHEGSAEDVGEAKAWRDDRAVEGLGVVKLEDRQIADVADWNRAHAPVRATGVVCVPAAGAKSAPEFGPMCWLTLAP